MRKEKSKSKLVEMIVTGAPHTKITMHYLPFKDFVYKQHVKVSIALPSVKVSIALPSITISNQDK